MIAIGWPQGVFLALLALSFLLNLTARQEDRYDLRFTIAAQVLGHGLLLWGGFYAAFTATAGALALWQLWPQAVVLAGSASVLLRAYRRSGEIIIRPSAAPMLVRAGLLCAILYAGGFFGPSPFH
ncbi:MAG: hypothetical protein AAFT19_07165 [Pseudomonadota bacterium]